VGTPAQENQVALEASDARVTSTSFSNKITRYSIEADYFTPCARESGVEKAEMKSRAK